MCPVHNLQLTAPQPQHKTHRRQRASLLKYQLQHIRQFLLRQPIRLNGQQYRRLPATAPRKRASSAYLTTGRLFGVAIPILLSVAPTTWSLMSIILMELRSTMVQSTLSVSLEIPLVVQRNIKAGKCIWTLRAKLPGQSWCKN